MNTLRTAVGLMALLALLAACTPIPSGTLFVAISGLPVGVDAPVRVTGPNDFARNLVASEELLALPPGSYLVSAEPVTVPGDTDYTVTVSGSPAEVTPNERSLVTVIYREVVVLR